MSEIVYRVKTGWTPDQRKKLTLKGVKRKLRRDSALKRMLRLTVDGVYHETEKFKTWEYLVAQSKLEQFKAILDEKHQKYTITEATSGQTTLPEVKVEKPVAEEKTVEVASTIKGTYEVTLNQELSKLDVAFCQRAIRDAIEDAVISADIFLYRQKWKSTHVKVEASK